MFPKILHLFFFYLASEHKLMLTYCQFIKFTKFRKKCLNMHTYNRQWRTVSSFARAPTGWLSLCQTPHWTSGPESQYWFLQSTASIGSGKMSHVIVVWIVFQRFSHMLNVSSKANDREMWKVWLIKREYFKRLIQKQVHLLLSWRHLNAHPRAEMKPLIIEVKVCIYLQNWNSKRRWFQCYIFYHMYHL